MRAWQVTRHGEPQDVLSCVECPPPPLREDTVRIAVDAAGLGLPDVFLCRGSYAFRPQFPFTPGQEVVGRVIESCEGGPPVGSRVMAVTAFFLGHGGFADEALALSSSTFDAPETLGDAEAAGFCIPYHTAWVGLVNRGRLQAGETLVVTGASGSSGAAAVQVGKALGARVVALAGDAGKRALCERLGADEVVDSGTDDLSGAIRAATAGRGADVVFDVVGGQTFMACTRSLANEGRLLAVGYASGAWANASTARMVQTNASVLGVYVGAYDRAQMEAVHAAVVAQKASGAIAPPPTREWGFEALPEALQQLADRAALGKTVVRVRTPAGG